MNPSKVLMVLNKVRDAKVFRRSGLPEGSKEWHFANRDVIALEQAIERLRESYYGLEGPPVKSKGPAQTPRRTTQADPALGADLTFAPSHTP